MGWLGVSSFKQFKCNFPISQPTTTITNKFSATLITSFLWLVNLVRLRWIVTHLWHANSPTARSLRTLTMSLLSPFSDPNSPFKFELKDSIKCLKLKNVSLNNLQEIDRWRLGDCMYVICVAVVRNCACLFLFISISVPEAEAEAKIGSWSSVCSIRREGQIGK